MSDKAYQASCIRLLISYLSTHGYDQALSPKLLSSPMSKDVTCIMHFLLRQVSPPLSTHPACLAALAPCRQLLLSQT